MLVCLGNNRERIVQCKKETEKLFNEYCELFPNSIEAY